MKRPDYTSPAPPSRSGPDFPPRQSFIESRKKSPVAFSLGGGDTAAIVVTDCILAGLTLREQCGILAHEISHLRHGDLMLQQFGLVLGWVTRVLSQIGCIFVLVSLLTRAFSEAWPLLLTLLLLVTAPVAVSLLRLALSREREAEADLDAAKLTDDPAALASALSKASPNAGKPAQARAEGEANNAPAYAFRRSPADRQTYSRPQRPFDASELARC